VIIFVEMEKLVSDLSSLLQDGSGSDLTLVCPDGEVQVHKWMMAARSPVFQSLLNSDMQEATSGIVKIEDFKIDVVKAMVHYIYTAQIDEGFENVVILMKIGVKYLIQALVDDCSRKLLKGISASNVLELGVEADIYSVHELMEGCAKFIGDNMKVLEEDWKDQLKNSPRFLISIVECMKHKIVVVLPAEVTRFGEVNNPNLSSWACAGRTDAIAFQPSHAATLTYVGLFGTKNYELLRVTIEVFNSRLVPIYMLTTCFTSSGSANPVHVPVTVRLKAGIEYTLSISMVINRDNAHTYYGERGEKVLKYSDKLTVQFKDSHKSETGTSVDRGQIPMLGFTI